MIGDIIKNIVGAATVGILAFTLITGFAARNHPEVTPIQTSAVINPVTTTSPTLTTIISTAPTTTNSQIATSPLLTLNYDTPTPVFEMMSTVQPIPSQDAVLTKTYTWKYGLSEWTWELKIYQSSYDYYKRLPRPPTRNYSVYVTHPSDDQYINKLAEKIRNVGKEAGYSEFDTVSLTAAFVQSLEYTSDSVTTGFDEYPRYPVETLVDGGGDCEDTAILTAALIKALGYDVILIRFGDLPDGTSHLGVGISCNERTPGTRWEYQGRHYYYLETTGSGWGIGELPEQYRGRLARVFPLSPVAILTHSVETSTKGRYLELKVTVQNLGSAVAEYVQVFAGFDAGNNTSWNSQYSQYFTLGINQSGISTLYLTPPPNKYTRLIIQIIYRGYSVDRSDSNWFNT